MFLTEEIPRQKYIKYPIQPNIFGQKVRNYEIIDKKQG